MENETIALVAKLVAAFPNREIPAATVKVYVGHLSCIPTQLLAIAVDELIQTSVFFPTIAELRKAAAQAKLGDVPSAEEAWSEVLTEMRSTGRQYTPDFSHRAIDRAVRDVGGWRYLCNSEGLSFERTYFLKTFKDLVSRAERITLRISEGTKNLELPGGGEKKGEDNEGNDQKGG
jgi:hypothetical protein